jgi:hypothetical protein
VFDNDEMACGFSIVPDSMFEDDMIGEAGVEGKLFVLKTAR